MRWLALFCCSLVGCDWLLPLPPTADVVLPDVHDAGRDHAGRDHLVAQDLPITHDRSPSDQLPDMAPPDMAPPDMAPPDMPPPDMPPPDMPPPDVPPPDQGPPPPPCSTLAIEYSPTATWTDMVPCKSKSPTGQQSAAAACNSNGWHHCTTAEYLDRGGKSPMLTSQSPVYWLAGCVEPGKPPTNVVCPSFPQGCTTPCDVGWGCTGTLKITRTGFAVYPLSAHTTCYKIGKNNSQYGAYWFTLTPGGSPSATGAVCCRDP